MTALSDALALHPFVKQVVVDRIRGAVVGSALGDAVGLYTEFLNKPTVKNVYPSGKFSLTSNVTRFFSDAHRSKFIEGEWTDDTDHVLLIILSFLHGDGKVVSSRDFAGRLKTWVEHGLLCLDRLPVDIGITIGGTVMRNRYLDNPKAAAYKKWKSGRFRNAANGSLMRTYPLGIICLSKSIEDTFRTSVDFSAVTHPDPRCLVSCCIATALVRGLILGQVQKEEDIDLLVESAAAYVESYVSQPSFQHPELERDSNEQLNLEHYDSSEIPPPFNLQELYRHTQSESFSSLQLDDLPKIGYVYKCLGCSILCLRLAMRRSQEAATTTKTIFSSQQIFEDVITELTLEGGDADTNGAVAGALVGSYLGFSMLPPHWYQGVKNVDWLLTKTDALIHTLDIDQCAVGYVGHADPDTREDGGKGVLDEEPSEAKETASKTSDAYTGQLDGHKEDSGDRMDKRKNSAGQALMKRWKEAFG